MTTAAAPTPDWAGAEPRARRRTWQTAALSVLRSSSGPVSTTSIEEQVAASSGSLLLPLSALCRIGFAERVGTEAVRFGHGHWRWLWRITELGAAWPADMHAPTPTQAKIFAALRANGPMSSGDLTKLLGKAKERTVESVAHMRRIGMVRIQSRASRSTQSVYALEPRVLAEATARIAA